MQIFFIWTFLIFFNFKWLCTLSNCLYTDNITLTTLDLTGLSNKIIVGTDGTYIYNYTTCRNDVKCSNFGVSSMVAQMTINDHSICNTYLATYSAMDLPSYDGFEWTFKLSSGQTSSGCLTGRKLNIYFVCNDESNPFANVRVTTTQSCTYAMSIDTCLACGKSACVISLPDDSDNGLSGGWVFIIILLVGAFLYFAIGYAYLSYKNPNSYKDFKNNIPNKTFWILLPKYTFAGCVVTKEFIINTYNKYSNKSTTGGEETKKMTEDTEK